MATTAESGQLDRTPFDLVIRGGNVLDGTGSGMRAVDVGIRGDKIAAIGQNLPTGREEIDATGKIVTPGFVDIHSHYDGQAAWGSRLEPSSSHGVTTVVTGNCGIGFAPCRPADRPKLIELMEGVEDIPEVVMAEGLPWNWESFPDYLDALEARSHDINIAAQVPHSALRVYVMGERGLDRQPATSADIQEMARLSREAIRAGAIGIATSRAFIHRSSNGEMIPTYDVAEAELQALAAAMRTEGSGVFQIVADVEEDRADANFALYRRIVEQSGRPLSFSLAQPMSQPNVWRTMLGKLDEAAEAGLPIRAQVIGRGVGMLLGLDLSFHSFTFCPSYKEIAALPLADRVAEMRKPERRARILADQPEDNGQPFLNYLRRYDSMFDLGDPPNYEPSRENSIEAIARRRGLPPEEVAYDLLLERDGKAIIFLPRANYCAGNLDVALTMVKHPGTVLGLADGGAHCGVICDASSSTFMLTHWTRDRAGEKLALPDVIRALTAEPAETVGLRDRGLIAPGYKADINVIDHDALTLHGPAMVADLPAGGRRLHQTATGYLATIVNGQIARRNDQPTGVLAGQLVRGAQAAPLG